MSKRKRSRRNPQSHSQSVGLGEAWFGDYYSLGNARERVQQILLADPKMYHDGDDDWEDDEEPPFPEYGYMLEKHGDIAVLSASGEMVNKESWLNRYFGVISYQEIRNAAITAANSGVKALLLDLDTSGGSAEGIGELSDFLFEFDKSTLPVYTYTGSKMLSAGYWIGASGRKIFSSSMAMSGSIGVVSAHFSYVEMMKKQGIDVTMFRQGEFKALGSPYEKLDEKARTEIEARMGKFYEMFLGHVSSRRGIAIPTLIETAAEGRVFMGADALRVGLVDSITTFDKAVSAVLELVSDRRPLVSSTNPSTSIGMDDMKRRLTDAGLAAVASGMDEKAALADPKLSEEVVEKTAEELAAEKAAADQLAAEQAAAEATKLAEAEKAKKPAAETPAAGTDATLVDRLVAMSAELATAKADLVLANTKLQEQEAHMGTLKKIAGDAINKMEVPMNRQTTNHSSMSASAVIDTYHRTLSDFNSRFKIGAQAETASEDDLGDKQKPGAYVPDTSCVSL